MLTSRSDTTADALLFLQPDRAVSPHLQYGRARLHPAARQRGETQSG